MGCCDRNVHIETCDHLVSWDDIVGDPSKNPQLGKFVDEKIEEATGGASGDIQKKLDDLKEELEKEIQDVSKEVEDIDAYQVKYKDTTVGDVLDAMEKVDPIAGTISEFPVYEKGKRLDNLQLVWSFNKPVKTVQIKCHPAYENDDIIDVDPKDNSYIFNGITGDQTFTVVGKTEKGEELQLKTQIKFRLLYFWGSHTEKVPCNEAILSMNNQLARFKETVHIKHILNCSGGEGEYMFFMFPDRLHKDYSFFTNGMKDTNWDRQVINVSNKYGYQAKYVMYRSGNKQTGSEIFAEVHAHDCY